LFEKAAIFLISHRGLNKPAQERQLTEEGAERGLRSRTAKEAAAKRREGTSVPVAMNADIATTTATKRAIVAFSLLHLFIKIAETKRATLTIVLNGENTELGGLGKSGKANGGPATAPRLRPRLTKNALTIVLFTEGGPIVEKIIRNLDEACSVAESVAQARSTRTEIISDPRSSKKTISEVTEELAGLPLLVVHVVHLALAAEAIVLAIMRREIVEHVRNTTLVKELALFVATFVAFKITEELVLIVTDVNRGTLSLVANRVEGGRIVATSKIVTEDVLANGTEPRAMLATTLVAHIQSNSDIDTVLRTAEATKAGAEARAKSTGACPTKALPVAPSHLLEATDTALFANVIGS